MIPFGLRLPGGSATLGDGMSFSSVFLLLLAVNAPASSGDEYRLFQASRPWVQDYPRVQAVGGELIQSPALPPGAKNPEDLHRLGGQGETSFGAVNLPGKLEDRLRAAQAAKPAVDAAQKALLARRYDFTGKTHAKAVMSGGKPVPVGPVARLPKAVADWERLGALSAAEIKRRGAFPYLPLPHPLHSTGGMVFPHPMRPELARVDVDFDLPDAYLPEIPPPLFLTTRPDLGDVSKGAAVESDNLHLLEGILTGDQLAGFLALNTPLMANWHNQSMRRVTGVYGREAEGMRCFDCHLNGHTNGAFALDPSVRPQLVRARLDTPSLRGLYAQEPQSLRRALIGSGHFSNVEEYFDSDPSVGEALGPKRLNHETLRQIQAFLNIIDFPPAPKLNPAGRLIADLATPSELKGQELFHGKARCAECHAPPHFTDNQMHDLLAERFYAGRAEGAAKTFPLRGIKDSPPYYHDGRLPTIEDTVEFFNIILQTRLTRQEKADLADFLRAL